MHDTSDTLLLFQKSEDLLSGTLDLRPWAPKAPTKTDKAASKEPIIIHSFIYSPDS